VKILRTLISSLPGARLAGLLSAFVLLPAPASARDLQSNSFETRKSEAHQLYHEGKVKQAIRKLQNLVAEAPSATEKAMLQRGLMEICAAGYDWSCVNDTTQQLLRAMQADRRLAAAFLPEVVLYEAKLARWIRNDALIATLLERGGPFAYSNPIAHASTVAELQLVLHDHFVRKNDLKAAEESLSSAILMLLLTDPSNSHVVSKILIGLIQALVHAQDVVAAARLFDLSERFIAKSVHPNSPLYAEYRMAAGYLLSFTNLHESTAATLIEAARLYQQLEIDEQAKVQQMATANSLASAALALSAKPAEAAALHAQHPMQKQKADLLQRGTFVSFPEFYFAVSDVFLGALADGRADPRWKPLFEKELSWQLGPVEGAIHSAYRHAALGLLTPDRTEARRLLRLAAKERIDTFEAAIQANFEGFQVAGLIDKIVITAGLSAAVEDGDSASLDLMLRGSEILGRNLRHSLADVAVLLGSQSNDKSRRDAHSYIHLLERKRQWELDRVRELLDQGSGFDRARAIAAHGDAIATVSKLKRSLATERRLAQARGFPTVAALQQSLRDGEAFIGYFPHADGQGKFCVTRSSAIFATAPASPIGEIRKDLRLLEFAVTASHAANDKLDAQFPVSAALNVREFLFGGLDACLQPGMRVTIALPLAVSSVPLGALLREAPPSNGDGFDLAKARWLIKDVSFAQVLSPRHYLATVFALQRTRAARRFLGIGDPALNPVHTSKLTSADRFQGSLKTPNGISDFKELPETGEELRAVAKQLGVPESDILVRDRATEDIVRTKPLGEYDVIHFATHGLLAEEITGLTESALMLTPGRVEHTSDDGLLSASEISHLVLNARLVVLSACNTARYDTTHASQAVRDLQMAFTVAGAPTLVASLWPVESTIARDIVTRFFSEWHAGSGAADSLARATRSFLDGAAAPYQHPRFWAPFVVMGNGAVKGGALQQAQ
jgi:CHAT domain-containing protein